MSSPNQHDIIVAIGDAFALRYVSVAGFVFLFYDQLLTIVDEIQYIWKARHSVAKYTFLFNKYLVLSLMFVSIHQMCGFSGMLYSDSQCKKLIVVTCSLGIVSLVMSNMLILHRVLDLWRDSKTTRMFLCTMHAASSSLSISLAAVTYKRAFPDIYWSEITNMCVIPSLPSYTALWGAPMFFELSMVVSVIYNTMATPRSTSLPLTRALQNNGILFFLFVLCSRLINVIISGAARKTLALLWIYFSWASIMTLLSRSVLRLRKAEIEAGVYANLDMMNKSYQITDGIVYVLPLSFLKRKQ